MGKAYLLVICLLVTSFTGCIYENDSDDEPTLRESVEKLFAAMNARDGGKYCSHRLDYYGNFLNDTEKEACSAEWNLPAEFPEWQDKYSFTNYSEEKQDYKASESSGYVYVVSISVEDCHRWNSTEPWNCWNPDRVMYWAKVDGQWAFNLQGFEGYYPSSIWTLEEADTGEMYSLNQYYDDDGVTLVEFFHSQCGHCQEQAPVLKDIHGNYSSQINMFSIGGYKLGSNTDSKGNVASFKFQYHNSQWPHLYDSSGELMGEYGFNSYPSMVLIKNDEIVYSHSGRLTYGQLSAEIDKHL